MKHQVHRTIPMFTEKSGERKTGKQKGGTRSKLPENPSLPRSLRSSNLASWRKISTWVSRTVNKPGTFRSRNTVKPLLISNYLRGTKSSRECRTTRHTQDRIQQVRVSHLPKLWPTRNISRSMIWMADSVLTESPVMDLETQSAILKMNWGVDLSMTWTRRLKRSCPLK